MLAAPAAAPPSAATLPGVCLPIVSCDPTAGLAGDAARTAARGSLDALGGWISDGALALLGQVTDEMGRTTAPTLDASWFLAHAQVMETLAVLVLLPLLLASIMGALVHQDPGRLIRTVAVHLPLALGGGFVAVLLTGMALSLTDQLCDFVSVGLHNDVVGSVGNIGLAMRSVSETTLNPGAGGFLGFLVALLVTLGALLIWLELLLRSAAIYVAVMFLPLALSGLVWPVTARWAKRLVEILVALILSKFVVVAVISLATGAVAANPKDGVSAGLGGGALLLLAGFAPFAVLRTGARRGGLRRRSPRRQRPAAGDRRRRLDPDGSPADPGRRRRWWGRRDWRPPRRWPVPPPPSWPCRPRGTLPSCPVWRRPTARPVKPAPAGPGPGPAGRGPAGPTWLPLPGSDAPGRQTRRRDRCPAAIRRAAVATSHEPRRYTFGPLDRRGVVMGFQASQLAVAGTACLVAVGIMRVDPTAPGLLIAAGVVVGAVGAACCSVSGRPAASWVSVVTAWVWRRVRRTRTSPQPLVGHRAHALSGPVAAGPGPITPAADWPLPGLSGLGVTVHAASAGQPQVAVVSDRRAATYAAVVAVRARSFSLLDPDDKQQRLAAWGAALAALAREGSPVHRLQWIERVVPGDAGDLLDHLGRAGVRRRGWRRSYADLVTAAGPTIREHEVLLVLAVRARGRSGRFGSGRDGPVGLLRRELHLLEAATRCRRPRHRSGPGRGRPGRRPAGRGRPRGPDQASHPTPTAGPGVAPGVRRRVGLLSDRRHLARHLLGGGMAAPRRRAGLPVAPVAESRAAPDGGRHHGAGRAGPGGAPGRGGPHRRPGRRRAAATGRFPHHGAAPTGGGTCGAAEHGVG